MDKSWIKRTLSRPVRNAVQFIIVISLKNALYVSLNQGLLKRLRGEGDMQRILPGWSVSVARSLYIMG